MFQGTQPVHWRHRQIDLQFQQFAQALFPVAVFLEVLVGNQEVDGDFRMCVIGTARTSQCEAAHKFRRDISTAPLNVTIERFKYISSTDFETILKYIAKQSPN